MKESLRVRITNGTVTAMKGGKIVRNEKLLHVKSKVILPNVLLLRDIPTPRILLFIFLFGLIKQSNDKSFLM
jgi:hypothetical protein